jgi:hypothetical protein
MDYQLIATLGPKSDNERTWQAMLVAGAAGFRLNTSHLSPAQLASWVERLGVFFATQDSVPPLVLDLQGSKWRLGQFPECVLTSGQRVTLIRAASVDGPGALPVPHADFFRAAPLSSGEIVLDDAKMRLALEAQGPDTDMLLHARPQHVRRPIHLHQHTARQNVEDLVLEPVVVHAAPVALPEDQFLSAVAFVDDPVLLAPHLGVNLDLVVTHLPLPAACPAARLRPKERRHAAARDRVAADRRLVRQHETPVARPERIVRPAQLRAGRGRVLRHVLEDLPRQ